jgi:RNA polymerase sigma-70 factor (ECF subfamily)
MNAQERERLFLELFAEYRPRVLRLCHGYLNSPEDAEDLFQEIMTRVWAGLPGFRGEARASTWLYRIAVNSALLYRSRRRVPAPLEDVTDGRPAPAEEMEKRERIAALRKAIAALPEQDRLIATLLLEGVSYKEIAEITGLTVNHVGVKITRIKQALEKSLRESKDGKLR